MFVAETSLLQAVRNKLILDLLLTENQCDVELDGQIPAIAKNDYFAVCPAGLRPGPRHRSSGGVYDLTVDVRVVMYRRVPEIARDRRRNVFIDLLRGMGLKLEQVIRSLDNNYTLTTNAATIIADIIADTDIDPTPPAIAANATGEWPEPFRTFTPDPKPTMVFRETYDAAEFAGATADPIIAISRGILFSGARYLQVR